MKSAMTPEAWNRRAAPDERSKSDDVVSRFLRHPICEGEDEYRFRLSPAEYRELSMVLLLGATKRAAQDAAAGDAAEWTSVGKIVERVGQQEDPLRAAIDQACEIIEVADARLLADDGEVGGQPPRMTLAEWRKLYRTLDKARKTAQ